MKTNNNINLTLWQTLEKNENKDVTKLVNTIEYFNLDNNIFEINRHINRQIPQNYQSGESFLAENKFYDLNWQIIFEDSSSECNNIANIKILVKIKFMNISSLKIEELNLIMTEKNFEEFFDEIKKISKKI